MSTLTAADAEAAYDHTRAVMASTPGHRGEAGQQRGYAAAVEQAVTEAWRQADPEGAAELDEAMAAAEGYAGEADPFAPAREQAARDELRAELVDELEVEAG